MVQNESYAEDRFRVGDWLMTMLPKNFEPDVGHTGGLRRVQIMSFPKNNKQANEMKVVLDKERLARIKKLKNLTSLPIKAENFLDLRGRICITSTNRTVHRLVALEEC
ncbi:hypothetical protein RvY_16553-2 [Ramazzottius varieornatus]|uniref:Uncharacterized protein n=1 Tax=Ramazzottius varieornatus TaxID=947166 RepID=A0A1D1W370_RAMVA|nr:hypothetical protein RvY_16553-2 [Ramazzottius varieornatus]